MGLMQQQQPQQPDGGSSYWGNLAQFGLFPNGRGGVAPVGSGAGHGLAGPIGQVDHTAGRPQNMAVGKLHFILKQVYIVHWSLSIQTSPVIDTPSS
jgi:hypothetical protein